MLFAETFIEGLNEVNDLNDDRPPFIEVRPKCAASGGVFSSTANGDLTATPGFRDILYLTAPALFTRATQRVGPDPLAT